VINDQSTNVFNVLGGNWDPTDKKFSSVNSSRQDLVPTCKAFPNIEARTSRRSSVTGQNHYKTVSLNVVAAITLLLGRWTLYNSLTAGRWYTKLVIIETHDSTMTNQFMNDLTESI